MLGPNVACAKKREAISGVVVALVVTEARNCEPPLVVAPCGVGALSPITTLAAVAVLLLLTLAPSSVLPPPHAERIANEVAASVVRIVAEFIAVFLKC
jgi:hypothetical protein